MDWDYDEFIEGYINNNNWEIKINDENHGVYLTKEEAVDELIVYIDNIVDENLDNDISKMIFDEVINNQDDLYNYLLLMDSDLFDITISIILEYYDNIMTIRLINLDGDEPSFGEL